LNLFLQRLKHVRFVRRVVQVNLRLILAFPLN
jgi:hypothetical protein